MDTIFSYELRREQPLSTEEKQRIRVILNAYRIPEEQLSSWNGDSCSLPLFRCFEVPLLYSEHIRIADSETAYTAAAHWCCMLDALQEALSGVVISAVMQEAVVHDAENGFLIPLWTGKRFCDAKGRSVWKLLWTVRSRKNRFCSQSRHLYMQPGCILSLFYNRKLNSRLLHLKPDCKSFCLPAIVIF